MASASRGFRLQAEDSQYLCVSAVRTVSVLQQVGKECIKRLRLSVGVTLIASTPQAQQRSTAIVGARVSDGAGSAPIDASGELYLYSKSDGMIRRVLGATTQLAPCALCPKPWPFALSPVPSALF